MNRSYYLFFLLLLFFSCSDDLTVGSTPGSVSGRIYPREGGATIGVYQSVINLIEESKSNTDGTFLIEDVPPGNYLLKISAPGYGRFEMDNVNVISGSVRDIGDIMLSKLPWPIVSSDIDRLEGVIRVGGSISFRVSQELDEDLSTSGVSINPEVPGFNVSFSRTTFRISGDWIFSTDYSVNLDTTIRTIFGYPLEFRWTQPFTIEPFSISAFGIPSKWTPTSSLNFILNGEVSAQTVSDNIVITPNITFDPEIREDRRIRFRVFIKPRVRWPTGFTNITIKKGLTESGGSTLESDTTVAIFMNLMSVIHTIPSDGETSASDSLGIDIRFSAPLNIETAQNAVTINPTVSFSTDFGIADEFIFINPDFGLESATTYTVTIDTSLKDIWGNPMDMPYQFSFTTK